MSKSERIVLLVDEYMPEGRRNHARMMHHLALELKKRGHHVIVITPSATSSRELWMYEEFEGITVLRIRSMRLRGVGNLRRAIAETLLPFQTLRVLFRGAVRDDVALCVNYSPTIFWGPVALWFKFRGAMTYLVLRDFFPQWLIDEGVIRAWGATAIHFRIFEKLNYFSSDCIALQSPGNLEVFRSQSNYNYKKTHVLFNWIRGGSSSKSDFGKRLLRSCAADDAIVLFYGGAIGAAQNIDIILDLAKRLRDLSGVLFLIVGEGGEFQRIQLRVKLEELNNVIVHPAVCEEDYISVLQEVDVGLISLKSSHRAHNIPGKIMSYLQNGLPILGVVNAGNDLIEMVSNNRVGVLAEGDDINTFERYAREMIEAVQIGETEGVAGRAMQMAEQFFSVEAAADQILKRTILG